MNNPTFGIYIPSYKRAKTCYAHKFLEYGTYIVRESEYEEYCEALADFSDHIKVQAVEDHLICGLTEVNQWLIDNAPEDVIAILDDDIHHFYYRMFETTSITDPALITSELERVGQIMADLGIGFGATDATIRPWNYDCEFAFKGCAGAVRWINRRTFKGKCEKDLEYNYDLDLVLQELLVNTMVGHGESQDIYISGKFSFDILADQVMEVVDHLKLEKCHFLSLSIGSIVSQVIAQRYPTRVNKLVLAGAITELGLKAKVLAGLTNRLKRILPFKMIKWLLVNVVVPQKESREIYMESVEKVSYSNFLMWMEIIPKMNKAVSDLFRKNCTLPTMYLMGVADRLFIKEAKRAADSNPNSSFMVVPDAGHACSLDNKTFFNKASIEYLLA